MPYKDVEARRRYAREWLANRRRTWLADKVCAVCGSRDRLEVDHIDPGQKINHRVWSWSARRRDVELAKCQVLCFTHHRIKTARERQEGACRHGHPWTDATRRIRVTPSGHESWTCRVCHRNEMRARRGS